MKLSTVLLTSTLLLVLFQPKAQASFHDYQEMPGTTNGGSKLYLDANNVFLQRAGNRRFHYVISKTKPQRNIKGQLWFDESAIPATGVTPWCRFGKVQRDTRLPFDSRVSASPSWFVEKSIPVQGACDYEYTLTVKADSVASKNLLAKVCSSETLSED